MLSGLHGLFRNLTASKQPSRTNILSDEVTASMLGPKHYTIKNPNNIFKVGSRGCYGENSVEQGTVASLMDIIGDFDYVFGAGDNFYKFGLDSADDTRAVKEFEHIYRNPALRQLCKKMFIEIPGNHDESLCTLDSVIENSLSYTGKYAETIRSTLPAKYKPSGAHGEARAKHEVDLTFKHLPRTMFIDSELDPARHQGWVMPHFYNTYTDGTIDVCAVDSNTILEYYLVYLRSLINGEPLDPNNQHLFMKSHYEQARSKNHGVILLQHHPLISSSKQRNEAHIYLETLQVKQLDRILQLDISDENFLPLVSQILTASNEAELGFIDNIPPASKNPFDYERLLRDYYKQQEMAFDLIICAHDHNLSYFNNKNDEQAAYKICQITNGGGGAPPNDLMARKTYGRQDFMGCFLKKNGFTRISADKKNPRLIFTDVYTTDGLHLRFSNESHEPLRNICEDKTSETLRAIILDACHTYLRQEQKIEVSGLLKNSYTHTDEQDDCAHYLWAYLNQPLLPDIDAIRAKLKECIDTLPDASKLARTSFYRILNKKLLENNQPRLDRLFAEPEPAEIGWGTVSNRF